MSLFEIIIIIEVAYLGVIFTVYMIHFDDILVDWYNRIANSDEDEED
jgi:hypothetical protein